jgi:hypothetical protein
MVEFEVLLRLAAGRGFWRGPALVTTAQFAAASFASSPSLWWWWSFVECVVCVVVVVFDSACHVTLLLLI